AAAESRHALVALWSVAAPGCCSEGGGTSDIFVAISVQATTGPAQTQAYPISQSRRPGRQLSLRCIPSRPALSFALALALHQYQERNLFPRTSRWLLLEEPYTSLGIALPMVRR